jgi:BCD family chlorophyll transporter-like MFS transporter
MWIGQFASAFAFLLVGAGLQTTQTAGLALATDLAPAEVRPRVIALMYAMLLVGMVAAGLAFGRLLTDFNEIRLIQVVQGAAVVTMALNITALWRQEARHSTVAAPQTRSRFADSWQQFKKHERAARFLIAVGLGTAAFNMQDIVLEPYGGEILHLPVAATTALTAMLAGGMLAAFSIAARFLGHGADPYRVAAYGVVFGLAAFAAVLFAAPMESPLLFKLGVLGIGFGGGLFSVGTLAGAMARERNGESGLALGAWGAVQATSAGIAIALGGAVRDGITNLAVHGALGPALTGPSTGYGAVYQIEIFLLFATLIAIGPLVRSGSRAGVQSGKEYGLTSTSNLIPP